MQKYKKKAIRKKKIAKSEWIGWLLINTARLQGYERIRFIPAHKGIHHSYFSFIR